MLRNIILSSKKFKVFNALNVSDNTVSSWREISKLGQAFPNLTCLVLADCPIASLDVTSPNSSPDRGNSRNGEGAAYTRSESECESSASNLDSPHHHFRSLKFLNLNNTLLATWDDIDRLACFPLLEHLKIHGLPLFEVIFIMFVLLVLLLNF